MSGAIEKNLGDALAQFVRGPTSGATVLKFSSNAGADALKELSRYRAYSTASHAERRQESDGTQP